MTTPAVLPESTRKSQHDALQAHIQGMDDQLADIQRYHPDARLRAGASLTRSLLASRSDKAKAFFKAGGNPSIDGSAEVLASVNGFIDKAKAALPPGTTVTADDDNTPPATAA